MSLPSPKRTSILLAIPMILILAVLGVYVFANYQARALVDSRIADMVASGAYQSMAYDDFSLAIDGSMEMSRLQVLDAEGLEYEISRIEISDFDYFNSVPRSLSMTATGLRFPGGLPDFSNTANNALIDYLDTVMEEDSLPLQFSYQHDYNPELDHQLDSTFSLSLPDSLSFSTQSRMRNISLEDMQDGAGTLTVNPLQNPGLMQSDIPSASMSMQDLGLVNALMAIQGEYFGMSGDEYRQQLLAQIQTMTLFAPQQLQVLAQEVAAALVEFVKGGKTLRLSIAPEYEGNIQRLQGEIMGAFYTGNFGRIVELLHLEIETY